MGVELVVDDRLQGLSLALREFEVEGDLGQGSRNQPVVNRLSVWNGKVVNTFAFKKVSCLVFSSFNS